MDLPAIIGAIVALCIAIFGFWAAFGPSARLNDLNTPNMGEGIFWRMMYGLIALGALTAAYVEATQGGRISNHTFGSTSKGGFAY